MLFYKGTNSILNMHHIMEFIKVFSKGTNSNLNMQHLIHGLGHKSWQLFYFVDTCERITNYMCRVECLQA